MPSNPEDHAWSVWWLLGPALLFGATYACSAAQQHERVLVIQDAAASDEAHAEVPVEEEPRAPGLPS